MHLDGLDFIHQGPNGEDRPFDFVAEAERPAGDKLKFAEGNGVGQGEIAIQIVDSEGEGLPLAAEALADFHHPVDDDGAAEPGDVLLPVDEVAVVALDARVELLLEEELREGLGFVFSGDVERAGLEVSDLFSVGLLASLLGCYLNWATGTHEQRVRLPLHRPCLAGPLLHLRALLPDQLLPAEQRIPRVLNDLRPPQLLLPAPVQVDVGPQLPILPLGLPGPLNFEVQGAIFEFAFDVGIFVKLAVADAGDPAVGEGVGVGQVDGELAGVDIAGVVLALVFVVVVVGDVGGLLGLAGGSAFVVGEGVFLWGDFDAGLGGLLPSQFSVVHNITIK